MYIIHYKYNYSISANPYTLQICNICPAIILNCTQPHIRFAHIHSLCRPIFTQQYVSLTPRLFANSCCCERCMQTSSSVDSAPLASARYFNICRFTRLQTKIIILVVWLQFDKRMVVHFFYPKHTPLYIFQNYCY